MHNRPCGGNPSIKSRIPALKFQNMDASAFVFWFNLQNER
jgi:hypothetical protein